MNQTDSHPTAVDPAAVLGAAVSLKKACEEAADRGRQFNLSEAYHGGDEFMRQVMRVATLFESWSCEHVDFTQLSDVWPYLLEDKFGEACLEVMFPTGLADFDQIDCLRTAMKMRLPVKVTDGLPVPVRLMVENPITGSLYRHFEIRSVRRHREDGDVWQYTMDDEPEDEDFGEVFFGLYGLDAEGMAEHVADRETYAGIRALAVRIAPGVGFPEEVTLRDAE